MKTTIKKITLKTMCVLAAVCCGTMSNAQFATVGNDIHNTNTGNVGIGTGAVAPAYKLDVTGSAVAMRLKSTGNNASVIIDRPSTTYTAQFYFRTNNANKWTLGMATGSDNFSLINGTGTSAINVLKSSNNVGIGTTTPAARLSVKNTDLSGITGTGAFQIGESNTYNLVMDNDEIQTRWKGLGNTLSLQYSSGDLNVCNGGGTANFVGPVQMLANVNTFNGFGIDANQLNNGDLTYSATFGGLASGEGIGSKRTAVGNQFGLDFYTNFINRMAITNTGSVGIGTTGPGTILHVTGSRADDVGIAFVENTANNNSGECDGLGIRAGDNINGNLSWMIYFQRPDGTTIGTVEQNSVSSVAYNTTSDLRLKTNIRETKYGLKTVLGIKACDYNYKNDLTSDQTGFVAQQLYEQYPGAVSKGGDDPKKRPWMVDYSKLTPVLVKAIQEQQQQIDAKDAKIDALEKKMEQFETALAQCCTNFVPSTEKQSASDKATDVAKLEQNQPNPFNKESVIKYYVPSTSRSAKITVSDMVGKQLKSFNITGSGFGQITISANELTAGNYVYSLVIDDTKIDTKRMELTK